MHRTRNPANRLEIGAQVQILYSPLKFFCLLLNLFAFEIEMKLQTGWSKIPLGVKLSTPSKS